MIQVDANNTILDIQREVTDLDLVCLIHMHIKSYIGDTVANVFLNDPDIVTVKDSPSYIQRVIVTKWLRDVLLRYCGITGKPVNNVLILLVPDGEPSDFMQLFMLHVFPFIKDNNVIQTAYGLV